MNKREKEVLKASLEDEKAILKKLEDNYTKALADVKQKIKILQSDSDVQSKAYQLQFQKQLEKQISASLDVLQNNNFTSIKDYLNACYNNGFIGTMYDLQGQGVYMTLPINQNQVLKTISKTGDDIKLVNKPGVSTTELKKQVVSELQRGFSTSATYADIARNISAYGQAHMNRSMLIARTEGHRVQNEAEMDALHAAKDKGADVVKQWDCTLDSKTRETHRQLDGQVREIDEYFEVDGKKALYPGGFYDPAEDCNCRCCLLKRARWGVEGETTYKKWNNETGGLIECSGFEDFKEKYLDKAKSLTNSENSGILNISGALNPTSKKAIEHAQQYYNAVRKMTTDCKRIAANTEYTEKQISDIKDYIFMDKHDLGGETPEYFYPSYEMAQTWQRLIDGKDIQTHDLTLLKHEIMERDLMLQGISQSEAHIITSQRYNYAKEARAYYDKINRNNKK